MIIYSIPHTGTHFLKDLLEKSGLTVKALHIEGWKPTKEHIINPIREPFKTWVTWESRNREQDFKIRWLLLDEIYRTQDVSIIPIDTDDRDKHLQDLSKRLNLELYTEWKPVSSQPHKAVKKIDLKEIYYLSVVKKYYSNQWLTGNKDNARR